MGERYPALMKALAKLDEAEFKDGMAGISEWSAIAAVRAATESGDVEKIAKTESELKEIEDATRKAFEAYHYVKNRI